MSPAGETSDNDYDFDRDLVWGQICAAVTAAADNPYHLEAANALMVPSIGPGRRRLPSATDILSIEAASNWGDGQHRLAATGFLRLRRQRGLEHGGELGRKSNTRLERRRVHAIRRVRVSLRDRLRAEPPGRRGHVDPGRLARSSISRRISRLDKGAEYSVRVGRQRRRGRGGADPGRRRSLSVVVVGRAGRYRSPGN